MSDAITDKRSEPEYKCKRCGEVVDRRVQHHCSPELAPSIPATVLGSTFSGRVTASYIEHVYGVLTERASMQSTIDSLKKRFEETVPFSSPVTVNSITMNSFKVRRDALIRFLELEIVRLNDDLVALRVLPEE